VCVCACVRARVCVWNDGKVVHVMHPKKEN